MGNEIIPLERITEKIYLFRKHPVMLDRDLAKLYNVETKHLKQAVRRNINRFPSDFMFELNEKELQNLRCQIGTSSWGGTRYTPMAFTEQGVAMLSSVLNSERAVKVNIAIMRAFVQLRKMANNYTDLLKIIEVIEKKYDKKFVMVFEAIKQLMQPPDKLKRKIGFKQ